MKNRFWETKKLEDMSEEEWEAVCDGCARCCLIKLEDADDGTVYYTDIACKMLDLKSCRCRDYANRSTVVPSCVRLSKDRLDDLWQMPPSCSYRRLAEGRGLADWHHLLSLDLESAHAQGWSIRDAASSESELSPVTDIEDRLVDWPILDSPITPGRRDF